MKSWDRGCILKLSKYDTTPIGKAKFLLPLKNAAIQYVESENNNAANENNDSVESRDADLRRMNSMDAFLRRMNSTIIQWRTYLASLNGRQAWKSSSSLYIVLEVRRGGKDQEQ
jgi:hypothetical protein